MGANAEANANFGQAFSIWDTLFGTARARCPDGGPELEFGLDEFRDRKFHLPHYLLVQPLLPRANEPIIAAASRS